MCVSECVFVLTGEESRTNKLVQVLLPSEDGDYLSVMEQNSFAWQFFSVDKYDYDRVRFRMEAITKSFFVYIMTDS